MEAEELLRVNVCCFWVKISVAYKHLQCVVSCCEYLFSLVLGWIAVWDTAFRKTLISISKPQHLAWASCSFRFICSTCPSLRFYKQIRPHMYLFSLAHKEDTHFMWIYPLATEKFSIWTSHALEAPIQTNTKTPCDGLGWEGRRNRNTIPKLSVCLCHGCWELDVFMCCRDLFWALVLFLVHFPLFQKQWVRVSKCMYIVYTSVLCNFHHLPTENIQIQ